MSQLPSNDGFTYSAPPSKGMAITSLVLGVLGCIPLAGIVAVVLGAIAMKKAKSDPQRFDGFGLALGGVICGAVFTLTGCLSLGVLLPALGQARQSARQLKSQVQLQQIGFALHSYAIDNKDVFPESDQTWQTRLVPNYIPDSSVFEIPGHDDVSNPAKYVYIPGLALRDLKDPASTALVYESSPRPWKNRVCVLFADGHVEKIEADRLQSVLAASQNTSAPKSGDTKPRNSGR